jgi:uncharacterized protein (TIGR02246 family)
MSLVRHLTSAPVLAFLVLSALIRGAGAQSTEAELERDVWRPLLAASGAFDAEAFLAVYSPDLVRIAADQNEAYGLERYAEEIRAGFIRARDRGIVRTSDVRFLTRTSSDGLAFETGYFQSRVTMPDGEVRTRYSRFEFVMRQEEGRWKILVDRDTAEGGRITEAQYLAAAPMSSGAP